MSRTGKNLIGGVLALAVLMAIYVSYVLLRPAGPEPVAPIAGAPAQFTELVSRGRYLAKAADCVACHTQAGGQPYAGGLPFDLPFGTLYATNITPDHETGIGTWTDDQFVRAVRDGVGPAGNLYPAMPYTSYAAMSRDDVLAIKAYLFSLAPVKQPNKPLELPFPFNQRWGMALWKIGFFDNRRFAANPDKSPQWNRGAYLATALGHCGECHTPRNLAFAMKPSEYLAGEVVQGWLAFNITPHPQSGIGGWSDEQLAAYLSTGHAPGRSSASGPMAEAIQHSLQYLVPSDIQALVTYLRDIPALAGDESVAVNLKPEGALAASVVVPAQDKDDFGQRLFAQNCAGCHMWNGQGRQTPYAGLLGSTASNDPQARSVVSAILHGTHINIGGRHESMPAFGQSHSDVEIAAMANYVVSQFGAKQGSVTPAMVAQQRN
ncbi:cytochrome c [Pseudomonas sp. 5P_3.1_Bac2]|uniref:cytochrome c n=1 Tax=Pseudomonas sp. 5P_3.1_Bac2 TaxID=2971617 RepID=UPI0021C5EE9A|nr:cytochrome c [Pseudomonas sp. 5P_3.1_Bac2]MCU1719175.1 cytochrome c [Pseudomonas sp. 5P_3.1_Bac2]